jgi:transposase-like protein
MAWSTRGSTSLWRWESIKRAKTIFGFHKGATENQVDQLLADLASRRLDFSQRFIAVIDGGIALRTSIRKYCGDRVLIQRCQWHKRRNVTEHFVDDQRAYWNRKLANAYGLFGYEEAKRVLRQIRRELDNVNPSAARSLDEGFEETLTGAPPKGSRSVASDAEHEESHRVGFFASPHRLP